MRLAFVTSVLHIGLLVGCDSVGTDGEQSLECRRSNDCTSDSCCELDPADFGTNFCIIQEVSTLSIYCASVCNVTTDCVEGAVCVHPIPCDSDPQTTGTCQLSADVTDGFVECPE